jgi:NAD+ kinase
MVGESADHLTPQRSVQRQRTACRVHQILEAERQARRTSPWREDVVLPGRALDKTTADRNGESKDKPDDEVEAIVRTRLLTKKQLSDMTWGVRQLSKKLGNLRLRLNVKTVFILTKVYDDELVYKSRQLVEWLLSKDRDTPYVV